jgi:hypothetical protein
MNKKLIAHETPLELMKSEDHFKINDYTYVLLHKLIEDPEYYNAVADIMNTGAFNGTSHAVYLDNSCFELGASLSNEMLYAWCQKITPAVVILPDTLGNKKATIDQTFEFLKSYPETAHYGMAVIQGSSPEEMIECYQEFRDFRIKSGLFPNTPEGVDQIYMIGIPFVYSWAEKDPIVQANERIKLLRRLHESKVIDKNRKHHLLGTWWAGEFAYYKEYDWVYSIDTSNPVMAAIDGNKYSTAGVIGKPIATFDKVYHMKKSDIDMDLLYHNVSMFKEIVNG